MGRKIRIALLIPLFFCAVCLSAQSLSNLRSRTIIPDTTHFPLDSLSILPGSLVVTGLDSSDYEIDYASATLILKNPSLLGQEIRCTYRTFPHNFAKPYFHKSTQLILPQLVKDPASHNLLAIPATAPEPLFDSQLQGTGSISRGVSIGNNQNFVLDANMNLQLSGYLAPDWEVIANITDESLPIQPEGNTRSIKDFSKVFIQLKYKDLLKIDAGDINIVTPDNSYFLKITRQFMGLDFRISSQFDTINKMQNRVGGGITKGKYTRNDITPVNGVQGPYRLHGTQNETAIVVLANSERVYLNGERLTRGQDADYTIDYNLGEITFTTKRLVTSQDRVAIVFEYSDRYYSRYNLFTFNEFTHEKNSKLRLNVHYFHEQDMKNQSIQPELDDDQKLLLSQVGDNLGAARYPTAMMVRDLLANEVLYHQRDTLVDGQCYSPVYVYAGSSRDSVYRVTFTYVGAGKGNYVLSRSSANGKLYQWVAPANGLPQGDYEPVMQLMAPKMADMLSVGAGFEGKKLSFSTEASFTYRDENTFSKSGDANNAGMAYHLNLAYKTKVGKRDTLWRYNLKLEYEWIHKNFVSIQAFRAVEFARDYNLANDRTYETSEQLMKLSTGFSHSKHGSTFYTANWLLRYNLLSALRNELVSNHNFGGWNWKSATSFLVSADSVQKTSFLKTDNDFSKSFSKVKIGIKENLEYNIFKEAKTDALRSNCYAFNEVAAYLTNSDSTGYDYFLQFRNRVDDNLYNDVLSVNAVAYEGQASFAFTKWKHNRLWGTFTYRNDNVRDTLRNFVAEHNFVGSLDYAGNFWKGAVSLGLYAEAGSGLEQRKNYAFLKVATGQGTHVWIDYNQNGIEELDEFELAAYQNEADYVKVWLATNEYVGTYNFGTTQTLQLRPANVWRNRTGFRKFLAMWSNATMLRTYQKTLAEAGFAVMNPFARSLEDSVLVSKTLSAKNTLSFSLPNPYFSADYSVMLNQARNLLYYGFENSTLNWQQVSLRSSPVKLLTIRTIYVRAINGNKSGYFDTRNFEILTHSLENELVFSFKCNLTLSARCKMSYKRDEATAGKVNMYEGAMDLNYRMKERGSLTANLRYISALGNIAQNSSLSYEMLEGLTLGNNLRWELSYQTKLFEYLQLNLLYEGRLTNESQLIHTGSLQLKAFF